MSSNNLDLNNIICISLSIYTNEKNHESIISNPFSWNNNNSDNNEINNSDNNNTNSSNSDNSQNNENVIIYKNVSKYIINI